VLKKDAGRMSAALVAEVPDEGQRPSISNFRYQLNNHAYQHALDRDGSYVLRRAPALLHHRRRA